MEKKGFLLLVGLFVLVAAACATTRSTPSLTASGSPKDDQSASAAASGTPDNLYRALIGEWRGQFRGGWLKSGFIGTLIIHEIDIANAKARCTWSVGGSDLKVPTWENMPIRADLIPGPSPKLKWQYESGRIQWEFVLKNNVLEGTQTQRGMFGPPGIINTTTMEKFLKK